MIHGTMLVNRTGCVLYSRWFDRKLTDRQSAELELNILALTKEGWGDVFTSESEQVATLDEKFILFDSIGELILFLVGSDIFDELGLSTVMKALKEALTQPRVLVAAPTTEVLLTKETLGKVAVVVDEMLSGGDLMTLDPIKVVKNSKLKFDPKKAADELEEWLKDKPTL